MNLKLIDNWRKAHKFYSVWLAALIAVLGFLQATILPMWNAQLSEHTYVAINSAIALLIYVARIISQGPDALGVSEEQQ